MSVLRGAAAAPLAGAALGIWLRIGSTIAFAAMAACIKALGDAVRLGQVVFVRSGVALVPFILVDEVERERSSYSGKHDGRSSSN